MRKIKLVERRVMERLLEAGQRAKGQWHDIDNGRGGSIYNRNEPIRRQKKITTHDVEVMCQKLWDKMKPRQRAIAVGEWDVSKAGMKANRLANLDWNAFIDVFFYTPLEEDTDTTRRLQELATALRWASD